MPSYTVSAAHRTTGAEISLTLNADSSSDAAQIANEHGFFVREVTNASAPATVQPTNASTQTQACEIARAIINDPAFARRFRLIINGCVWQGVLIALIVFVVFVPILLAIISVLGLITGSGIGGAFSR